VERENRSRVLPEKHADGNYHVDGNLDIASKEDTKRLVSTVIPLLRAGGRCRKIILTPAPRFKFKPCCTNKSHCTNLKDKAYCKWMEVRLTENRVTIRDYVKMRNIKRATVKQFCNLIEPSEGESTNLQEEEIWGDDPVHLTPKGYSMVASGLVALIQSQKETTHDVPVPQGGKQPAGKKLRRDLTMNRPAWCRGSVGEAVRSDSWRQRGSAVASRLGFRGRVRGGRPGGARGYAFIGHQPYRGHKMGWGRGR
jgi:hypothetical protein